MICGLSGGVDSSVAAALVHRAIGDRQTCIFINNGLLREGEFESTLALLKQTVEAEYSRRRCERNVSQRAERRRRSGERNEKLSAQLFIEVFEEEAKRIGDVEFLVQGTLYPDVIESVSVRGPR